MASSPTSAFTTQYASASALPAQQQQQQQQQQHDSYASAGIRRSPVAEPLRPVNTVITTEGSPIRVTCRTRSTTSSPLIPPQTTDGLQMDFTKQHSNFDLGYNSGSSVGSTPTHPYQMMFPSTADAQAHRSATASGAARHFMSSTPPLQPAPQQPAQPQQQQQPQAVQLPPSKSNSDVDDVELPPKVVHRSLHGRCKFIPFPTNLPSTPAPKKGDSSQHTPNVVFIGQVRLETTSAELIWLVHRVCGACATHLESRGTGCYLLYCKNSADLQLVRTLHKRVLFDVGGVWIARTPEEVDALCEYVALQAAPLSRSARLPRDSMVVEEFRAEATREHAHGSGAGHNHNQHSHYHHHNHQHTGGAGGGGRQSHNRHPQVQHPQPPQPQMYNANTNNNANYHQAPPPQYSYAVMGSPQQQQQQPQHQGPTPQAGVPGYTQMIGAAPQYPYPMYNMGAMYM